MRHLLILGVVLFLPVSLLVTYGFAEKTNQPEASLSSNVESYSDTIGHPIRFLLGNAPDNFRSQLLLVDTEKVLDHQARSQSVEEVDVAVLFLDEPSSFKDIPWYQDLKPLENQIMQGLKAPVYTQGLRIDADDGSKSIRLMYYVRSSSDAYYKQKGLDNPAGSGVDQICFARRIYGLAFFNNSKALLQRPFKSCDF